MRFFRLNLLLVLGLGLTFCVSTTLATSFDSVKPKKGMGVLAIRTAPGPLPVRIDDVDRGMSGVGTPAEFYLQPGPHKVEVLGPDGKVFSQLVDVKRDFCNYICLRSFKKP